MTEYARVPRDGPNIAGMCERLRAVESSQKPSDWSGIRQVTTNRNRNPDGPEAADLIEHLAAMLAASPQGAGSSADAQGWRDIATAPRDGSLILCFYPDRHGHDRYSLRYWATGDWGARSEGWSDQHRQLRKTEPAHWMPLPPLPSAHPAPIRPSGDTGELRERMKRAIWTQLPQEDANMGTSGRIADAILDLIQSERAG